MRILGVLDLMGGRAVHARGGRREQYSPVARVAGTEVDGDAVAVARAYVERFGIDELYVADLDAITSGVPQHTLVRSVARQAPLWLDTGASSVETARRALDAGAARVIVGLETLSSFDALAGVCLAVGSDRLAFSLDLRNGVPVARSRDVTAATPPDDIARQAVAAGAGAVIVLDLARVGAAAGVDVEMLGRVREAVAGVSLLAGGGIRGLEDLADVAAAGCDGALVASAIHDGRLTVADIAAARGLQRSVSR